MSATAHLANGHQTAPRLSSAYTWPHKREPSSSSTWGRLQQRSAANLLQRVQLGLLFVTMALAPFEGIGFDVGVHVTIASVPAYAYALVSLLDIDWRWQMRHNTPAMAFCYWLLLAAALVYLISPTLGAASVLGLQNANTLRFSSSRVVIHTIRLVAGLSIFLQVHQLISRSSSARVAFTRGVLVGALWVAVYSIYQFAAQRLGLPGGSLNTLHNVGGLYGVHYLSSDSTPWASTLYRIYATFGEGKSMCLYLIAVCPLLLGVYDQCKGHKRLRRRLRLLLIVLTVCYVLTFSRQGYLAASVSAVAAVLLIGRGTYRYLVVALCFCALTVVLLPGDTATFVRGLWQSVVSEESYARVVWQSTAETVRLVAENPVAGIGLGNNALVESYVWAAGAWQPAVTSWPMQSYVATGTGVLGFVLLMSFLMHIAMRMIRCSRALQTEGRTTWRAMALATIAMLGVMVTCSLRYFPNNLYIWAVLGYGVGLSDRLSRSATRPAVRRRLPTMVYR